MPNNAPAGHPSTQRRKARVDVPEAAARGGVDVVAVRAGQVQPFTMYDSARIERPHGTAFCSLQYTWARARHTRSGTSATDGPAPAPVPNGWSYWVECRYRMYHCRSCQHLHLVYSDPPSWKRFDTKPHLCVLYYPEQHYLFAFDRASLRARPPVSVRPPSPAAAFRKVFSFTLGSSLARRPPRSCPPWPA